MEPALRRPLRAVLWDLRVLWLTVALLLVAEVALRPLVQRGGDRGSSLDALLAHGREPRPAAAVLLGSSRFRRLPAEIVSEAAGGAPVANLAFNAGTWDAEWLLARTWLTPDVLARGGTRIVLLGSGVMDANDGYRNPVIAATLWGPLDFLGHVLANGTDGETRSFLLSRPPARWSGLLTATRRGQLRGVVRGAALRLTAWLGLTPAQAAKSEPRADDEADGTTDGAAAAGASSLAQVPPPNSSIYLRDFALGGRQTAALRALIRYLRAQGVTPVILHAPVSDWYGAVYTRGEDRAYRALVLQVAREEDVPAVLLDKAAYGLVDDDYFERDGRFDGHHILSERGRAAFARGIGERVVGPLLREIAAGRSPGFEHSLLGDAP